MITEGVAMNELNVAYNDLANACDDMTICENSIGILEDTAERFLTLETEIEDLSVLTEIEKDAVVPIVHHLYLMMKQYANRTQIDFDAAETEATRLSKKVARLEEMYDKMEAR